MIIRIEIIVLLPDLILIRGMSEALNDLFA